MIDLNYEKLVNGPDIVSRIDGVLELKDLKRQTLADFCGFSVPNIARWKTKGFLPDVRIGVAMSDFLNVNLRWLLTGGENCTTDLDPKDYAILDKFHALSESKQKAVRALIDALYEDKENNIL